MTPLIVPPALLVIDTSPLTNTGEKLPTIEPPDSLMITPLAMELVKLPMELEIFAAISGRMQKLIQA